jgi:hypothetical protein
VAVALFILLAVFSWAIKEGFQAAGMGVGAQDSSDIATAEGECAARTNCSTCLEPKRDVTADIKTIISNNLRDKKYPAEDVPKIVDGSDTYASYFARECYAKGGDYSRDTKAPYANKCIRRTNCGWCSGAQKCIPRTSADYPVVPVDKATNLPKFACPIEAATGGRNFLITKEDCPDFQCSSIKNCRDCAQAQRCGWVDDGTSSFCAERATPGGSTAAATVTVPAGKSFVTAAATCPARACEDITDCAECAMTPNCGYCEVKKKCLRLSRPAGDATPLEKCEKTDTVGGKEVKTAQQPIISRTQCPAERADTTLTQRSEQSDYKPSAGELAKIQDDLLGGGSDAAPAQATQTVPATGGAVSEPKKKDSVGAPGVSRLLGSGSYHTGGWPSAAGLDGQGGPFESYVQMLVKSELAGQGIVSSEPFKAAEPFSVKDVIRNAGKVLQGM